MGVSLRASRMAVAPVQPAASMLEGILQHHPALGPNTVTMQTQSGSISNLWALDLRCPGPWPTAAGP